MKFKIGKTRAAFVLAIAIPFLLTGCDPNMQGNLSTTNQANTNIQSANANSNAAPTVSENAKPTNFPVTLPILDAMFVDDNFSAELKSKLNLTDEQVAKLKQAAREATANLKESDEGSTAAARKRYQEQVKSIIGEDKVAGLTDLVSEKWSGNVENASADQKLNNIPTDTRIVVNAPAYRMDVFKDGQIVRSYKVGIGYPEFPLPTGMRKANEIIFNPTWTPPDEPWVEGSNKVKAGQKVEAGSSLNPLGPIKIPIGLPSLIHGGKSTAKLGTFASHGCVGLTSPQVQDFASVLAQISGTELSGDDITKYEKAKTETKNLKLAQTILVELRYETLVVEDGKLHVYRDVYERGTNTEENLRKVLEAYGVSLESLSEQERTKALDALKKMAVGAEGKTVEKSTDSNSNANVNTAAAKNKNDNTANKKDDSQSGKVTRNIKGQKEIVVEISALKGKGYPAPVDLNSGTKSNKPLNLNGKSNAESNSNMSNQPKGKAESRKF
ncbi:MAG: L,D-transpeptidase [Pyrinomonadaceae bacterium]